MNLQQLLLFIATSSSRDIPWESWLPLSIEAAKNPASWDQAWDQLDKEQRQAVIDRLVSDGSVFAYLLLQIATRYPEATDDLQVQSDLFYYYGTQVSDQQICLLKDYQQILDRTVKEALESESLGAEAADTLKEEAALVEDITKLEGQRASFLANHLEDKYGEMFRLRQEVNNLSLLKSQLENFDLVSKQAEEEHLLEEISTLDVRKTQFVDAIEAQRMQYDELQRTTQELEQTYSNRLADVKRWEKLLRNAESDKQEADDKVAEAQEEVQAISNQIRSLDKKLQDQKARINSLHEQLDYSQRALDELAKESEFIEEATAISDSIKVLFKKFKPDESDKTFG